MLQYSARPSAIRPSFLSILLTRRSCYKLILRTPLRLFQNGSLDLLDCLSMSTILLYIAAGLGFLDSRLSLVMEGTGHSLGWALLLITLFTLVIAIVLFLLDVYGSRNAERIKDLVGAAIESCLPTLRTQLREKFLQSGTDQDLQLWLLGSDEDVLDEIASSYIGDPLKAMIPHFELLKILGSVNGRFDPKHLAAVLFPENTGSDSVIGKLVDISRKASRRASSIVLHTSESPTSTQQNAIAESVCDDELSATFESMPFLMWAQAKFGTDTEATTQVGQLLRYLQVRFACGLATSLAVHDESCNLRRRIRHCSSGSTMAQGAPCLHMTMRHSSTA